MKIIYKLDDVCFQQLEAKYLAAVERRKNK